MKYDWILFDADGTLFDYDKAEARALENTFQQAGVGFQVGFATIYRQINTQIWLDFEQGKISLASLRTRRFALLLDKVGVAFNPELFSERYLENLGEGIDLMDGAQDLIKKLYGRTGLALVTNGIKEVQRSRLSKSALKDYFTEVVISEEVGFAKPDKRIFDEIFSRINSPDKERVLIVGDSLTSDIRGGADYGIHTCWFNPNQKSRDLDIRVTYEIKRLDELLSLLYLR